MGNILCRDRTPRRVYVKRPAVNNPQIFASDSMVNGTQKDREGGDSTNM